MKQFYLLGILAVLASGCGDVSDCSGVTTNNSIARDDVGSDTANLEARTTRHPIESGSCGSSSSANDQNDGTNACLYDPANCN